MATRTVPIDTTLVAVDAHMKIWSHLNRNVAMNGFETIPVDTILIAVGIAASRLMHNDHDYSNPVDQIVPE